MTTSEIIFLNARMHPWTMRDTVDAIMDRVDHDDFTQHCVVNVAKVVNMQKDTALREAVNNCDIINIDGQGVVWGARLCGMDIPERVAGIDLFYELLASSAQRGYPVFLLGAKEDIVNRTREVLAAKYPQLTIAGSHHGYFWDNEKAVVDLIAASGAKLLFVAISSPRKETFIDRWKDELGVNFVMGVGGTFDVVAGKSKRAPAWMQRAGLEWFFRLIQEPRRMWKRYLSTNSRFAWLLAKHLAGRRGTNKHNTL